VVSDSEIDKAVTILRAGGLVAFPTETVYGLGADASNPAAVRKIYETKGRPAGHPVIVHVADAVQLANWAREIPGAAHRLARRYWPGPLTLVLKPLWRRHRGPVGQPVRARVRDDGRARAAGVRERRRVRAGRRRG
jgi:tRNA threonylcarbamoyl adenosine modification protein (Sua5/YciO/YrdC/YwlC family)